MTSTDFTSIEKEEILREKAELSIYCRKRCSKESQIETISKAFNMANEAYEGMRRRSGEPYIMHPLAVARIVVCELGLGWKSICAALLHDVPESGRYSLDDIRVQINDKVATLVDGMLKIKTVLEGRDGENERSLQAESFKRMLLTLNDDARVVLLKLADRLHNTRNVEYMSAEKRERVLRENRYLFIPMAHRLGLYDIKSEMENIWLRFEQPEAYNEIINRTNSNSSNKDRMIDDFLIPIRSALEESGIVCTITKRVKTPYSIWNKMQTKGVSFDQIADLYAVRIVFRPESVDIESERSCCYRILEIIKSIYPYREDRIRDWISTPKSNGYEALHITSTAPSGDSVELQIRSVRMNEIAEKGLAAHWNYKKGKDEAPEGQLDLWLGRIKEILSEGDIDSLEKLEQVHKEFVNVQ